MPEKISVSELSEFLDALSGKKVRSRGERAATAEYIGNHNEALKELIESKKSRGGLGNIKLARRYSRLIKEYEESPRGIYYIEQEASLRTSFKLSRKTAALTFQTKNRWGKAIGYALAVIVTGFALWAGYQAKIYIEDIIKENAKSYERIIETDLEKRLKE